MKTLTLPKTRTWISALLILFLLVFPKGGIKVHNIPITWGYLLFIPVTYLLLFRHTVRLSLSHLLCLAAILPFSFYLLLSLFFKKDIDTGSCLSLLSSIVFLPIFFYSLLGNELHKQDFTKWILHSIFFIASYGIFLFFLKITKGVFLEIPFLTVNYHDVGLLESTKCIDRGGIFKLISTYNNGNLYGICTLMFFPLYISHETSFSKKSIFRLSLLLTLSRTVWVGWIFAECVTLLFLGKNPGKLIKFFVFSIFASISVFAMMQFFHFKLSFLLDASLGGRNQQFGVLQTLSFFGDDSFYGIYEIVYLGVLKSFGIFGFALFLLGITFPLFLTLKATQSLSSLTKSLRLGLLCYLFVSLSDGAIMLIPTLVFYFFIASWMISTIDYEKNLFSKDLPLGAT